MEGVSISNFLNLLSILLILSTTLNEYPLLNEPGIKKNDPNVDKYNLLISYKNIEFSIYGYMEFNIYLTKYSNLIFSSTNIEI